MANSNHDETKGMTDEDNKLNSCFGDDNLNLDVNHNLSPRKYSPSDVGIKLHRELVIINGRINEMDRNTLITNLKRLNLSPNGNIVAMKKRLKNHYKIQKLSAESLKTVNRMYPYYVVVDFEATCNEVNPLNYQHEIIEFPAVLVDSQMQTIVDEFHYYVKPKLNPVLSEFCTQLTGITQETVDKADDFVTVLKKFELWLKKHKLGNRNKYAFVTDGPWDMCRFLHLQCEISEIEYPYYAKRWINVRKTFSGFYKTKKMKLSCMLEELGIEFQGRLHSGLDDSRNIAKLLIAMIKDGVSLDINEHKYAMNKYYYQYNTTKKESSTGEVDCNNKNIKSVVTESVSEEDNDDLDTENRENGCHTINIRK